MAGYFYYTSTSRLAYMHIGIINLIMYFVQILFCIMIVASIVLVILHVINDLYYITLCVLNICEL